MNVIPFVHEGLGNSSYLVEIGEAEALLVDPDRTVQRYLQLAEARDRRITAVLETHLHADFVSGAKEVAFATGAAVFLPAGAHSRIAHHAAAPGERIRLDGIEVEPLASPGHTPEHLSYTVRAASREPMLFSGGSLIVGGAARTDLIAPDMTDTLSRAQFRTLHTAFNDLPDATLLYPTHGGGSFCSAGAGRQRTSTLGAERAQNPLLQFEDEDEFVRWFPTTFPGAPDYFFRMRAFNQRGPRLRAEITIPRPLSPHEFDSLCPQALVIDTRPRRDYLASHIPRSLSIPFRDAFAVWLGWLVPSEAALLFVTDGVDIERIVDEALLVGYEHFCGWIEGGIDAWRAAGLPAAGAPLVDVAAARRALLEGAVLVDVREPDEYAAGHIEGSVHIPLGKLAARARDLPDGPPVVAYCSAGDRAATAVSVLERAGRAPLLSLDGGADAWRAAGLPLLS